MHHDHIGIPKFIQRGFSINEKVFCYDIKRDKLYNCSIDRLGTEGNYYENDVENELLANGIEHEFAKFYKAFCGTTDTDFLVEILNSNVKLVTQFFSFMFMRAKKTLDVVNKESLTSQIFGDLSHSDLLRIQSVINTNPLELIGKEYRFYPLINFSKELFINNSLGFGVLINENKQISIIMLLNTRVGILISNNEVLNGNDVFYIAPEEQCKANKVNECICRLEKELGNGFIFGEPETKIDVYRNYIKTLNKRTCNCIELTGDALANDCDVLCHQVNLQGVMGGGIALSIARKFPNVEKEYSEYPNKKLGEVCFANTDSYVIANCFSQTNSFDTDYESLKICLDKVVEYLKDKGLTSVAIPYKYGCGIANGDWNTVKEIFVEKLKGFTLKIYKLKTA